MTAGFRCEVARRLQTSYSDGLKTESGVLFLGGLNDAGAVAKVVIALVAKQGDLCGLRKLDQIVECVRGAVVEMAEIAVTGRFHPSPEWVAVLLRVAKIPFMAVVDPGFSQRIRERRLRKALLARDRGQANVD